MRGAVLALCLTLVGASMARAAGIPQVVAVYPSGDRIPENLLRISIAFAAPPQEPILARLALFRSDATRIESPFLEQELWSPDRKTLTILLHPGRVKTGLIAHQTLGRALHDGDEVMLVLADKKIKLWHVELEDRAAPEPTHWTLGRAEIGTRKPIRVAFEGPIDAGSAQLIAVVGPDDRKVAGRINLARGEAEWVFTPAHPWKQAPYRLVVHPRLEDASGNAIRQAFEQPIAGPGTDTPQALALPIPLGHPDRL